MDSIKSTKVSTKFGNTQKLKQLHSFIDEYRKIVSQFVNLLWKLEKVPVLLPKAITNQINSSWLTVRAIQCAGKQASAIVRGTRKKQQKRLYIYNKLNTEGHYKQARKLKAIINKNNSQKPNINQVCPELDSRFVKQDWNNHTSFNGWITLTSLGNKLKISVPIKKTKHFNKMLTQGTIKPGIRLSKFSITFNFDLNEIKAKQIGKTVGLDIGLKNTFTLSTNVTSKPDNHGHTLESITKKLTRKKKGSKSFTQATVHRDNHIHWSLNQINFDNIKILKIENIKHLRKYRKTSRYLSHFTYTTIFNKLADLTTTNGVRLEKVNPTYTSQRCSNCGWVRKRNRNGKQFKCDVCKTKLDADLNASINISLDLPLITKAERLLHKNRKGFYWNEVGRNL